MLNLIEYKTYLHNNSPDKLTASKDKISQKILTFKNIDGFFAFKNTYTPNVIKFSSVESANYAFYANNDLAGLDAGGNIVPVSKFPCFNMPKLKTADYMFYGLEIPNMPLDGDTNENYAVYDGDLSNLESGVGMFSSTKLERFVSDMPKLKNGDSMFTHCTNLKSFISNLSSLETGTAMFASCKLDALSVVCILDSIPDYSNSSTSHSMTIGINVFTYPIDGKDTQTQLFEFSNECGFKTWDELKQSFADKGWRVIFQYGDPNQYRPITLDDESFRSTPIYANIIEVKPSGEKYTELEKASAEYCTEDGTKYYNIDWGHDVTHSDEFQYFGSLLEACGYYGVIPKKYLEES
jgi:hypothetical protein